MATKRAAPKLARGSTTPLLTRALAALDAGDHATAITELAAAWARRRSPVLADWVDLLDAQQAERPFAELLATRVDTTVNRLLSASSDDPRLASVLLDLLEHPRFLTDRAFWDLVLDRVAACADVRLHDSLPAIRATLTARITPVATRDHVVSRLDAIAKAIKAPRAASDKDAELERAIAQRLTGAKAKRDAEEQILREIYDDPLADGPRLVYADLLSERGDPRGELIALQFERRDKGLDESKKARERWLLKQHMKEWLGGLAPAVSNTQSYSATTFERGFVAIADIYNAAEKQLPLTWREPGWATVEELRGPFKHLIYEHAPLRGLRRMADVGLHEVRLVARIPAKFRHVDTVELSIGQDLFDKTWMRAEFGDCAGLPALRTLTMLFDGGLRAEHVGWALAEAKVVARLDRLVLGGLVSRTPELDRLNFEAILEMLPTMQAPVASLGIIPPWRSWPRPAPIELVRADDGAYRRV